MPGPPEPEAPVRPVEVAVSTIVLDGDSLTLEDVRRAALDGAVAIELAPHALERCDASRRTVEAILRSDRPIYGVNTGFGDLARVRISPDRLQVLQQNLIHSHAVGVGEALPEEVVRAVLLLRLNTLVKGFSGVRRQLLEVLRDMLDRGVHPVIPSQGSLGASGDLAPLAHLSLVALGEGQARYRGQLMAGALAMQRAGIQPVVLEPKEGLALINGTQVTSALAVMVLGLSLDLVKAATLIGGLSTEVLLGTDSAFDEDIQRVRPHPGQSRVATYLREMLVESEIRESHRGCPRVQDPYSIRCIPQVHGACLDAWDHARGVVQIEINSATDNPLIFGETVKTGGNFHGEPVGMVMDYLVIALCELGSISERRVARLVNSQLSGLPPFLTADSGLNSGMMIPHYTAASLVMENRVLAHPASVDSLPTSADQEDHVSMSTSAARKAWQVAHNLSRILAIELLTACQGVEFRRPLRPGQGTRVLHDRVRAISPPVDQDRELAGDIEAVARLLCDGALVAEAERAMGHRRASSMAW